MTETTDAVPTRATGAGRLRARVLPVVVLALLPTVVTELLFGSTTLSNLRGVVIEVPLYGAGALLIREVVRRRGGGWPSLLLLGAAYGAIEEGVLEPTWFTLQRLQAHPYGAAFGVDWPYAAFNIGYHAVWSITVPILLAELLFPGRRHEPWLRRAGIGVAAVCYVLAAAVSGVTWQLFLGPRVFHLPPASPGLLVAAAVLAVLLAAAGVAACRPWQARRRTAGAVTAGPTAPPAWVVGGVALLGALAWFVWFFVPDGGLRSWLPLPGLLLVDLATVVVAAGVVLRWSRRKGWGRGHTLALCSGAVVAHMAGGLKLYDYQLTGASLAFTVGVDVVALVLLALWIRRVYVSE